MASSNLDRLLLEILSNEPSRTSILEEDYEAESGCGVLLGAALRRNTFVSEIDLRVYALVSTMTHDLIWDDDDPDTETTRYNYASIDLRLLLDYLRGPIVQKIKLTPGLSQDQNVPLDNNAVLGVLLPAIAENPNLLEIDCELYVPPPTLAQFVQDARMSLVRFHLNIESCAYSDSDEYDRPQEGKEDRINVANAFKDNESLEYLHLYGISRFSDIDNDPNDYQMDLVERILTQLGTHPSLETLVLSADATSGKVPIPRALLLLMESAAASASSKLETIQLYQFHIPPLDMVELLSRQGQLSLALEECTRR